MLLYISFCGLGSRWLFDAYFLSPFSIISLFIVCCNRLEYNDENSLSCVISLAYYFAQKNYTLHREMPAGKGFADIVFEPKRNCNLPALIVELKWGHSAEEAVEQIKKKLPKSAEFMLT